MERTTLATATSLALLAMLSMPFAYAAGDPEQSTTAQVTKSQSDDPSKTKGADKAGSTANNGAIKTPPAKHPPTAIMDQATPTDKSATEKTKPTGHGPTSVMDRAAPDQKSPGAASNSDAPAK